MICHRCGVEMQSSVERYHYQESGLDNVYIEKCAVHVCKRCKIRMAILPDTETAAKEITRILVLKKKRLDGQSILYIRKAMRMKAAELAECLRVSRVAVSRWENNQVGIDAINDFRLRLTAIDRFIAPTQKDEAEVLRMLVCMIMQNNYEPDSDVGHEELTLFDPASDDAVASSANPKPVLSV